MAIQGVETKCYILSLFVRDDGERFVLGNGYYEFKDNQLHFQTNTIANDIVEVQGNDGILLAGQVRRPGTQSFDGYIADGTVSKTETEEKRRDFFQFFRKNYFYKVVYVFPDGTAIQRKRGFLVDDPTVSELYQQYPEYHVALNFEDVNYYSYSENDDGEEIFAKEALIYLSEGSTNGSLMWDEVGVEWDEVDEDLSRRIVVSGKDIVIDNVNTSPTPIQELKIKGDIFQKTYSGDNLFDYTDTTTVSTGITVDDNGWISGSYNNTSGSSTVYLNYFTKPLALASSTNYSLVIEVQSISGTGRIEGGGSNTASQVSHFNKEFTEMAANNTYVLPITSKSDVSGSNGIRMYLRFGTGQSGSIKFRVSVLADTSITPETFVYQPFTGNRLSPSQDYPQEVEVVTGNQMVEVSGKNLFSRDFVRSFSQLVPYGENGFTLTKGATPDSRTARFDFPVTLPAGTYTLSWTATGTSTDTRMTFVDYQNVNIVGNVQIVGESSITVTLERDLYRLYFFVSNNVADGSYTNIDNIQLEAGPVATDFQPYHSQLYPINLGSIELCKIGDVQDYIYRRGDEWYVRKEIQHWSFNVSDMNNNDAYPGWKGISPSVSAILGSVNAPLYNRALYSSNIALYDDTPSAFAANSGQNVIYLTTAHFGANYTQTYWMENYPDLTVDLYCQILTSPIETQITDTSLIEQLENLEGAMLAVGINNVITGSDGLNAEVGFSYRENALISGGAMWEEGSGGGPTVVEVDSIDKVYPIWTVTGPAVNPQLSVLSTNTTLHYSGTVTESQTLVIDMFNKTALLNGTSVIGNVSGDWVNFAPGNNRVVYTTNNADANPSKIEWQEVVG